MVDDRARNQEAATPGPGARRDVGRPAAASFPLLGQPSERMCRGCGCTDSHACPGGCSWAALDVDDDTGICSRCAERLRYHLGLMVTIGRDEEAFLQILAEIAGDPIVDVIPDPAWEALRR